MSLEKCAWNLRADSRRLLQRQKTDEILGVIKKGNLPVSKATFYYAMLNHEEILTNQREAPKTTGPLAMAYLACALIRPCVV